MSITELILITVFFILESGVGYLLNVCILVASAQNLRTGQRMNPPDVIHFTMGLVNITLQSLFCFQGLLFAFFISLLLTWNVYVPTIVGTLTLLYLIYWLTAWLCIYYCVTISTFNHPLIVWSKRNISMYLPSLLLLSAVGCFVINIPIIFTANMEATLQSAANSTLDPIFISWTFHLQPFYIHTASFLGCCIPFLLILVSIIVTNASLIRHLRKIKQKDSGLSQTKHPAHINAIRTMWLFLTISIIFCINEMLFFLMTPNPEGPFTTVNWLIFMSFPTAESLVIAFANPKLRRQIVAKILSFYRKL
ncbi:taste receptor type 2 member 143-like [Ranitomeya imitator]|uniref:taste receptor type 2 member 143-like n=1 Tax=Ranitomeya imitator TaxID=111125 RepID=UPI0037E84E95